jgi:transposase-like protein
MQSRKQEVINKAVIIASEDATQGARRATGDASSDAARPNPEVVPLAARRKFSAAEKNRILNLADNCTGPGEIGALLRREGIYSSHLATWRKHRRTSELAMLAEQKRGPKTNQATADARQVLELQRENARLRDKLAKADLIIDVQKKLSTLLGLTSADAPDEPKS